MTPAYPSEALGRLHPGGDGRSTGWDLTLRVGVGAGAAVWGGLLVMTGTALVTMGGGAGWVWLGVAALAAGNWVFAVGAANRVFPGRVESVSEAWEWAAAGVMGIAVVGWVATLTAGGSW